jgi:hypothetical protein
MNYKVAKDNGRILVNISEEIKKWGIIKGVSYKQLCIWVALLLKHPKAMKKLGPNRVEIIDDEIFYIMEGNISSRTIDKVVTDYINWLRETLSAIHASAMIYHQIMSDIK